MQRVRLTHLFCLVALATSLVGCGVLTSPPTPTPTATQPPPTSTPVPPTNTPVPTDTALPTDTPTPVPTQSLMSLVNALTVVASGNGVAEAAAYDPSKIGSHPIVIISSKDQDGWNDNLPVSWKPLYVGQVELVAALNYSQTQIEHRIYYLRGSGAGGVSVGSYRVDTEVVLREAQTGELIARATFKGGKTPPLPNRLPAGTQAVYGSIVDYQTVQDWLSSFVEK